MPEELAGAQEQKVSTKVGRRIKALRLKADMNQESLAFAVGSTQPYIAKIEGGEGNVGTDILQRIADALNVDISQLFELRHDMPAELLLPELEKMLKKADEDKLRLIFRIVDAIIH